MALFSYFLCYFACCMKKYSIEVTEILRRIMEVEASDADDAIAKVRQMYRNCDIVLDASDYERTEISVKSEKAGRNVRNVEIIQ